VFERPAKGQPFRLVELAPGVTADELRAKTEAHYEVALADTGAVALS
jgi:3-oxoacid CoA-transferase subunit B